MHIAMMRLLLTVMSLVNTL